MSHSRIHGEEHSQGEVDEVNAGDLGSGEAESGQQLVADGSGGIEWRDREHGHLDLGVHGWLRSGEGDWDYYIYENRSRVTNGHSGSVGYAQSGSLYRSLILPSDFKGFVKLVVETYIFGGFPDSYDLTLSKNGEEDGTMNEVDVTPSETDKFEVTELLLDGDYESGDAILLELQSTCENDVHAELSSFKIVYER